MTNRGNCSAVPMRLLCILLAGILPMSVFSQALCPPNLDFELGDFSNWECRTGVVSGANNSNQITWLGVGQSFDRHTIIPANSGGQDPYGLFPENCPNGSGYSIKLGNSQSGAQAEGVFYTYTIPANVTQFSIIYYYAIVLQDPNHPSHEQPRFMARIVDLSENRQIDCVSFDFTASGSLPGFQASPVVPSILYKDWTPITLDLTTYAGKTIQLEFITSDCTRGGHFGYAYIDVNAACNGAIIGSTICAGETTANLQAPFGFQSYEWFADVSFSQVISTGQALFLDPAPAVGTIYPVIVTPYPGFGCRDTLYANITTSPKPPSVAGPDVVACRNLSVQIGGPPTVGYSYLWTPSHLLSNPAAANPFAANNLPGPVEFRLKTTDLATGCFSFDTAFVTPIAVDTAMMVAGRSAYCVGETVNLSLAVSNALVSIQWYNENTPVPGATAPTYQPTLPGNYWAQVVENSCTDSTRRIPLFISPLPTADFTLTRDTQCVNTQFTITNLSVINPQEPMNYLWRFSDGSTSQDMNAVKTFTTPGPYSVEMVAMSTRNCRDSLTRTFRIMPNAAPDFVWDSICVNRPVNFTNLTNENGSPQVDYLWDFKNASTSSVQDPPEQVYTASGAFDVSLRVSALGCEDQAKTMTKTVLSNAPAKGYNHPNLTIVENKTATLSARSGIGNVYQWRPQLQLNNYTVRQPLFTGINDVKYFIDITDIHTCITTDTMQLMVLKKPGVYLPSAFTPNGDGKNDVIKPYLVRMKDLKKFIIYNRYGNVVFSTSQEGVGWNGMHQGRYLDNGVYVWFIEYTTIDGELKMEKGTITLIR
jgi:gliding motility-associated-like protein